MEYYVMGETVPIVEVKMNTGESVYTQSSGMAYQTEGIEMTTNARGGVMKSIGRMFAGESLFMANYTATKDNAVVAFASTVPGKIVPIDLSQMPQGIILQKGAFLCAEQSIETSIAFTKKISAGLFGGEGFILQRAVGNGNLFIEVDGDMIEKHLEAGEVIKVDTGNVVAFEPSVTYEIETIKGIKNIFLGGEGLFITRLTGPGKVIIQSQNIMDFAKRIVPFVPTSK